MSIKETIEKIKRNIKFLDFSSSYDSGNSATPYTAKNLVQLKDAINDLEDIEFLKPQIKKLKENKLFANYKDWDMFTSSDDSIIKSIVGELKIGLRFLLNYYYTTNTFSDTVIQIKIPDIVSFDDLSRISNDLKRAIEITINDSNTEGHVEILTAESGSIWIIISVATISAVNLIAGICWSAAVIRRKNAEAKMIETNIKTLELKNDVITTLVEAQKTQWNNILTAEAEAIIAKHYNHNDPETVSRLKLSLTTVADLIDRGAKILPNTENEDVTKLFPDYNNLNLIASSIKQLKDGQN